MTDRQLAQAALKWCLAERRRLEAQEDRRLVKEALRLCQREQERLALRDAARQLARRAGTLQDLMRGKRFDPSEPRDPDGEWTSGGGGGHGNQGGGKPASGKPARHERPKALRAAGRYRDAGRRRRVIAAVKVEGQLAEGVHGFNLPDSEPADVVYAEGADGKPITTRDGIRRTLLAREHAARILSRQSSTKEAKESAERLLSLPCEFLECKTLLTSRKSAVHMSKAAIERKLRWTQRYRAGFSVVAVDRRKGGKHSGHEVHVSVGELGGTHRLEHMDKVNSFADVLSAVCPSCKGGKR
jgi:hypothetical protein